MGITQQVANVVRVRAPRQFRDKITVALEHGSVPQEIGLLPGQHQDTKIIRRHERLRRSSGPAEARIQYYQTMSPDLGYIFVISHQAPTFRFRNHGNKIADCARRYRIYSQVECPIPANPPSGELCHNSTPVNAKPYTILTVRCWFWQGPVAARPA